MNHSGHPEMHPNAALRKEGRNLLPWDRAGPHKATTANILPAAAQITRTELSELISIFQNGNYITAVSQAPGQP